MPGGIVTMAIASKISSVFCIQGDADVLVCVVDSVTNMVNVFDAWNPLPNHTPTTKDVSQEGLCVLATSFNNGMISCTYVNGSL